MLSNLWISISFSKSILVCVSHLLGCSAPNMQHQWFNNSSPAIQMRSTRLFKVTAAFCPQIRPRTELLVQMNRHVNHYKLNRNSSQRYREQCIFFLRLRCNFAPNFWKTRRGKQHLWNIEKSRPRVEMFRIFTIYCISVPNIQRALPTLTHSICEKIIVLEYLTICHRTNENMK